ncbi:serine/threonine protein kinase [Nostoc linckia NIES-25]|nr:serine/threonine protein kinase [Nostoc linckia NIES-25]
MFIGQTLGNHYKIKQLLGNGGFGDTYLAEDTHLPNHHLCAVKHLKPKHTDPAILPAARELFDREAKVLYGLSHDQIPKLLAFFEENGEFFIVQEYVDGGDLSRELTVGKRFGENEVIKLLQEILKVVQVIHNRNIIHRDIKPQNLMRRNNDKKIVLIDFGAVKEIKTLAVNPQGNIMSTIAIGTPGYMPDEQARRKPELSSDVYAIGIIAIQALTGLLPQDFILDAKTNEIIWRSNLQVSDKFADVVTKMVRYDFKQRYKSASEALAAINTLIPKSYSSQFVQFLSRIWKYPKLRTLASKIALIGIGAALTVGVFNLHQYLQTVTNSNKLPKIASPEKTTSPSPSIESPNISFVIEPKYDEAYDFSEGLARVKVDGKWGYIDRIGSFVIQPQFDEAEDFSEGLAVVWIAGQNRGYIDKTGTFVIQPQFVKNAAQKFSEGLARVWLVGTWGYIDNGGRFVIQRKFKESGDFSNGLAPVSINGKVGYIDRVGNQVIPPQFDSGNNFSEGLAVIKVGEKFGYIDIFGHLAVNPKFDSANNFSEGLAAISIEKKIGYIDNAGNLVIEPQFNSAHDFSEGLSAVSIGGKVGYVDKFGKFIIKPQFDGGDKFLEGLARISISGKIGYIDKSGNFIIKPQFDTARNFSENLAVVYVKEKSVLKAGYIYNPLK